MHPLPGRNSTLSSLHWPEAWAGVFHQPGLTQTKALKGVGESTAMPTECYILVFCRALAKVLEGDFLKMFRVCASMEWPGAAKTGTQARSRRHWTARKGKDRGKMRCDPPSREAGNPMAPAPHCVTGPSAPVMRAASDWSVQAGKLA